MTKTEKPFIAWIACEQTFYLFKKVEDMLDGQSSGTRLRHAQALEYWYDGSATFGTNAGRMAQNMLNAVYDTGEKQ